MLSAICFAAVAVLGVLACTRHRIFVICGFYAVYALVTVLDPDNVPRLGPITVYRALYAVIFISILARLAQDSSLRWKVRRWPIASYAFLLILILASALYSQTNNTFAGAEGTTLADVIAVFSLFWMAALQVERETDLKVLAATSILVSLVLSLWVIWSAAHFDFAPNRGGIDVNMNYVSQFVLAGGIPLVYFVIGGKARARWLLFAPILLCIMLGSLILASRGSFVAFVVGVLWMMAWIVRGLRQRRKALLRMGAALCVIFGIALLLPGSGGLLERFQGADIATLSDRTLVWHRAAIYFSDSSVLRMIFGQGLFSPSFVLSPYLSSDLVNYHNQYLKYLMEQGVVGLLAFLAFLYAVIHRANRCTHPLKPLMFGWLGFMVVTGFTSTIADSHQFWILFGVIAGLCGLEGGPQITAKAFAFPADPLLSHLHPRRAAEEF